MVFRPNQLIRLKEFKRKDMTTDLLYYFNNDIKPYADRIERNLAAMDERVIHITVKDESQPHKVGFKCYRYKKGNIKELVGIQWIPDTETHDES